MTHRFLAALFVGALALSACDSEPSEDPNPEEFITEVRLTMVNVDDAGDTATIVATDADGDGAGLTFSPSSLTLRPGATYTGSVELNDTINDESITEEIEEEAEEHLFRYTVSPASAGTVTITDTESDYVDGDENGGDFAVGLEFRVAVAESAEGTGTLGVVLYHFDDAPKTSGTATSDEIDMDIDVPLSLAGPTVAGPGAGR